MSSLKDYPAGRGVLQERYIKDILVQFGIAKTIKVNVTIAEFTATKILLPALPGVRWRLTDWRMIALAGNAAGATSCNITGTAAGSAVQLGAAAVAGLTRSTVLRAGASNAAVIADGASFVAMDANTAVTATVVSGPLTTATSVDIFLDYVADAA